MWQNQKSNYDKTKKKSSCDKTQIMTTLKLWQNSNYEKNYKITKLKLWQNSKTQCMTKLKKKTQTETKLELWKISI